MRLEKLTIAAYFDLLDMCTSSMTDVAERKKEALAGYDTTYTIFVRLKTLMKQWCLCMGHVFLKSNSKHLVRLKWSRKGGKRNQRV